MISIPPQPAAEEPVAMISTPPPAAAEPVAMITTPPQPAAAEPVGKQRRSNIDNNMKSIYEKLEQERIRLSNRHSLRLEKVREQCELLKGWSR
jgi:hypothetical protein